MQRILCLDDFRLYAEMVAQLLRLQGCYEIRAEIVPFDLEELAAYEPDLILINLVRKAETLDRGRVEDFYREVHGAKALRAITQANFSVPLVLTGVAVREGELPEGTPYDGFIEIPDNLHRLAGVVERLLNPRA